MLLRHADKHNCQYNEYRRFRVVVLEKSTESNVDGENDKHMDHREHETGMDTGVKTNRQTDRHTYRGISLCPRNSIFIRQQHNYMICTIKIASFDVIKWYMGRETPIKANNVAALIWNYIISLNENNLYIARKTKQTMRVYFV